jgi:hypothetical protein
VEEGNPKHQQHSPRGILGNLPDGENAVTARLPEHSALKREERFSLYF